MAKKLPKSDAEWRASLDPDRYEILRQGGTEPAFTGAYWDCKAPGVYRCAGCDTRLFRSSTKYDSGTGWPSFWEPIHEDAVEERTDTSYGMVRIEVVCATCAGHLGHVFPDGPPPTGRRYCMNSAALRLEGDAAPDASPEAEDD